MSCKVVPAKFAKFAKFAKLLINNHVTKSDLSHFLLIQPCLASVDPLFLVGYPYYVYLLSAD